MKTALKIKKQERNKALDLTRALAIIAVIMIHASADFVIQGVPGSAKYAWGNFFDSVARIGVPLFLMTSGALLLDEDREITVKQLFMNRVPKMACLLLFWSAFYMLAYCVARPLQAGRSVNVKEAGMAFIMGHTHLWYLFVQMGRYLATPLYILVSFGLVALLSMGVTFTVSKIPVVKKIVRA